MWNNRFEGWYFKHQHNQESIAFIPGRANGGAFVQVITNERSRYFEVPHIENKGDEISAGGCTFGTSGVTIDLPGISGTLRYGPLTPLRYDIMGPFRFFPMDCRHGVISMGHDLYGSLRVEGNEVAFDGGRGYIEKDSGGSFPKSYVWLQCNDFSGDCSVMVSVAHIPLAGLAFTGCICAIVYGGREYRLATYLGVKILQADENKILLSQGAHRLQIDIRNRGGHLLKAPAVGNMTRMVRESNTAAARFRFFEKDRLLFDLSSQNVGFECAGR